MTASSVPCALFLSLVDEERGGQLAAGLVHCNSISYVQMSRRSSPSPPQKERVGEGPFTASSVTLCIA